MRKIRRHRQPQPWDLFHPRPPMPTWEELPRLMQRQLTELMARLLREQHDQEEPRGADQEADHE